MVKMGMTVEGSEMSACSALEMLMEHAEKRSAAWTSASVVCAGVLLGLYDGSRWICRIDEFGVLDRPLREAALLAISSRAAMHLEPQDLIENGQCRFEALVDAWSGHPRVDRWARR
jgi:hypothetical protein